MRTWLLILLVVLMSACMNKTSPAEPNETNGTLSGKVTISPIYPHERLGVSNEASADLYTAHKIVVYKEDKKTVIKEQKLDEKGNFKVELAAGKYFVDVLPHDIGIHPTAEKIGQTVTIESGQTLKIQFNLDTGIR